MGGGGDARGELEVPTIWYAKISILWNIPLPVRIVAKRFRWCWTYPCASKLTWKIAKCAATPLRSVTSCRTKSWRNFQPGLWDDRMERARLWALVGTPMASANSGVSLFSLVALKLFRVNYGPKGIGNQWDKDCQPNRSEKAQPARRMHRSKYSVHTFRSVLRVKGEFFAR